jgi:hypothetical protein
MAPYLFAPPEIILPKLNNTYKRNKTLEHSNLHTSIMQITLCLK